MLNAEERDGPMNDDRDEAGARAVAHAALYPLRDGCGHATDPFPHSPRCLALTAAILSYGDARAAGERERINAVLRKAWSEEVAERLIRESSKT